MATKAGLESALRQKTAECEDLASRLEQKQNPLSIDDALDLIFSIDCKEEARAEVLIHSLFASLNNLEQDRGAVFGDYYPVIGGLLEKIMQK